MMIAPRSSAMRLVRRTLALVIAGYVMAGCASSVSAPSPRVAAPALDGVRRVVVVASGESHFTVLPGRKEPGRDFDEVINWLPFKEIVVPIAHAVYWFVSWLVEADRAASTVPPDVAPGVVVANAFARTLRAGGPFDEIVARDREPVGDDRRHADAIVRVSVPTWGVVPVRDGDPQLVAAFADVRAQVVLQETGVVAWQHDEDVTHPDRLSLDTLTGDRALARDELIGVLERAGRRLANEFLYARGSGR